MSHNEMIDADKRGPESGKIAVVALTTSSSSTDLSAAAQLGPGFDGHMVEMVCSQNVFYKWDDASGTSDDTATTGANRVFMLPANVIKREKPMGVFFTAKAAASANIRISIASGA